MISGGNVKAVGTQYGAGIGTGYGSKVDGIYISGGHVDAQGGKYAPAGLERQEALYGSK